jgi:CheY-like chemotaxis protein/tetratricopeptide (TPR) repeat protein
MSATILCVHEDRDIARLNSEVLEGEGYQVLCAHDGRQAFEFLKSHRPDFTVLDAQLPRQDGFEVLAEIRTLETCREMPVLLVSDGDVTADLTNRAKGLGAIGLEVGPLSPDRLIERVESFTKSTEAHAHGPGLASSGSLKETPVPELFHALRRDRHTGVVLLNHGKKKKAVELRDGWPISVKSNLISECLGGYLVQNALCAQEELDESVNRMRAGEGLQGQILVAMQVLDEDAMVDALKTHALEKFFEIFSWRDGGYVVRPDAHVQRGSRLALEGHPTNLIVEGVRRAYPLKQIDRFFEGHADAYLVPRTEGEEQISEVVLSSEELEWLQSLDGSTTLGELMAESEWVRRLAFGFISIEFMSVDDCPGDETDSRGIVGRVAGGESQEPAPSDEAIRAELAELANRVRNRDHYGVLDVATDADDEEIRVAYARLAKRTHPDRFHGASRSVRQLASQVFDRVAQAHSAIATSEERGVYARELARGRRQDAAEDEGRRALRAELEFQKGEAKMASRDYEGALLCFGRSMENFPAEGEYRSHYGWCLYLCHPDNDVMLGEALEHCREGLKLAKDREKPYLLLGRLYKAMGKAGAAKKMFSRAVEIKPQCVEAMRELRIMNMRRDRSQGIVHGVGKGVLKRIFRR